MSRVTNDCSATLRKEACAGQEKCVTEANVSYDMLRLTCVGQVDIRGGEREGCREVL